MDPRQVVFTGNQVRLLAFDFRSEECPQHSAHLAGPLSLPPEQFDVVNGVLDGQFDVGFVRTDTIERTVDAYGNPINPDNFKVIEPKIFVLDDGNLFPFLHST